MRCTLAAVVIAANLTAPAAATATTVVAFEFGQNVDGPFAYETAGRRWNTLAALNGGSAYRGLDWSSGWEIVTADMIRDYDRRTPGATMGAEAASNGDGARTVGVAADGVPRFRLVGADFRAWPWRDRSFGASASSHTIAGGDARWWLMDNLEIVATPLPAAAWMMLAGLGGIAGLCRRRSGTG